MPKTNSHKFILGTVQMGLNYGINNSNGKVSLKDSLEILEYAYDNSIKILDSAEAYGNAHQIIGTFHKSQPSKLFEVITKLPHHFDSGIEEKVTAYLSELQVTQLHALLFHSFDSYQKNIKNFEVLLKLKADHKIKHIGVSVYNNEEIESVILNDHVDIIQIPFNLLDNAALRGSILEKAKSKGKIIHTRSAFLQGLFFKAIDSENNTVKQLTKELKQLNHIKEQNEISMAQLALNYCLQQQAIDNVLIGVDAKAQLADNLNATNYTILPEVIKEIDTIKVKNSDLLNPSLWA
ncbi:aldo/keto reductase [Winogradskyella forsetii]|uniref:aldo/keto reductase n=1 Tax=Winogradskyella forsetii TaxID=2686077 RepID=UPI0015BAD2E9|nr:aldo/keto reductase [Winogradskyella forsetii]